MSAPAKKPPVKAKASLIAAANQPKPNAVAGSSAQLAPAAPPAAATSQPAMQRTLTSGSTASGSGSARSTPGVTDGAAVQRLKFKPKVPIKKAVIQPVIKPDPGVVAPPPTGGGMRGRGRGGAGGRGGRGGAQVSQSVSSGIFGGPRNIYNSRGGGAGSSAPRAYFEDVADEYSDDEETGTVAAEIVDISAVSGLGESAPTSLLRVGRQIAETKEEKDEKKKKKEIRHAKREKIKNKGKERAYNGGSDVKAEPISPEKRGMEIEEFEEEEEGGMNAGVKPPVGFREDDHVMDDDLTQDRDEQGRRVNEKGEEVNTAQMMDLSESEEEEEEESMEGDFVPTPGYDDPNSKLYIFQFPHLFPKFLPRAPIDLTDEKEAKPDLKPTAAQLKAQAVKAKRALQPEGRIGSLVVMKSGKVKVIMGNDIVMNITPGVPCTFLQQLVHVDTPHKSLNVLGEINKHYVLTPDINRLLKELWLNDGVTPADMVKKADALKVKDVPEQYDPDGLQEMKEEYE